jgi:nitrate reductase NapE
MIAKSRHGFWEKITLPQQGSGFALFDLNQGSRPIYGHFFPRLGPQPWWEGNGVAEQIQRRMADNVRRRRMEILAFLFLTVFLVPALAVATVGAYGLSVWVYQMIAGPPGPPAR